MKHIQIKRYLECCSVIDWVESHPFDITGHVDEKFYRGNFALEWDDNLPRLLLHQVHRYFPKSGKWSSHSTIERRSFDFSDLKARQIDFSIEVLSNRSLRFNVTLSITGIIRPRSLVQFQHAFAAQSRLSWEKQTDRILGSIEVAAR